ncbi:MAG: T9SS type A sorting domain-containing protein [Bacteroidota bacterium]
MSSLERLNLSGNQLSGAVPPALTVLTALQMANLSGNNLRELPAWTGLDTLDVRANRLGFDSVLRNVHPTRPIFLFDPQQPFSVLAPQQVEEGSTILLRLAEPLQDPSNMYRWYKDGAFLAAASTDTLTLEHVTLEEAGHYHLEVTNSGVPGLTLASPPILVSVQPSPLRSIAPVPVSPYDGAIQDIPLVLQWDSVPNAARYRVQVAQEPSFRSPVVDLVVEAETATTLQESDELQAGYTYYWRVQGINDVAESPFSSGRRVATYAARFPLVVNVPFADPNQASNYRLVGLPGGEATPAGGLFEGQPGAAGNWRLFRELGAEAAYPDHLAEYDSSEAFNMTPGTGFWLLSDRSWLFADTLSSVPLDSDGTYTIPIQAGWNIISNPLDASVTWRSVQEFNPTVSQPLYRFRGAFAATDTFATARTGEAFYYYNDTTDEALRVPYPTIAPQAARKQPSPAEVILHVGVEVAGQPLGRVSVELHPDGAPGLDPGDAWAPPAYFGQGGVYLVAPTPDAGYRDETRAPHPSAGLSRERRPPGAHGYALALDVDLPASIPHDAYLELRLDDDLWRRARPGDQVRVLDGETGVAHDLASGATVRLSVDAAARPLRLLIGAAAYVALETASTVPPALTLAPNYPNPFNPSTTVVYAVPDALAGERLRVEVFNALGQRVAVLADRVHEAGRYEITWSAVAQGSEWASGVYYSRLTGGGRTLTRPMLLLR